MKWPWLSLVAAVSLAVAACSSSKDAGADSLRVPGLAADSSATPAVPALATPSDDAGLWLIAFASNLQDTSGGGCRYSDTTGCDLFTVVYDAATGEVSNLELVAGQPGVGEWFPSLSSDGCWIAYNADAKDHSTVASVVHVPTGEVFEIGGESRFPDWAPDGSAIAWASSGQTPQNVFLTSVEADCGAATFSTGAVTQLTDEVARESRAGDPDFFPGGDALSLHIDGGKNVPSQAAVINADGTGLVELTPVDGSGHTAVRPDGMAVVAGSSQAPILTLVEREGAAWGDPYAVITAGSPASYAAFDPRYASCGTVTLYYPAWLDSDHLIYSVTCMQGSKQQFSHLFMTDVSGGRSGDSIDLASLIEELAGADNKDFITAAAIPLSAAGDVAPAPSATAGSVEWQPGTVYVTFVSHNEEPSLRQPDYLNDPAFYAENRDLLVQLVELLTSNGAAYDFQSDWNFLQAVSRYDTGALTASTGGMNIVEWMASLGVSIDPHAHESRYNYADVASLISALGVEPSGVVGGFMYQPPANVDWDRFLAGALPGLAYPTASWDPSILWGAASTGHQGDEDSSGAWRPLDEAHFYSDDPASDLVYIGNCTSDLEGIESLLAGIDSGAAPADGFYTASIMVNQGQMDAATLAEVAAILESLRDEVASGRVVYLTIPEAAGLWQDSYGAAPSRYTCS